MENLARTKGFKTDSYFKSRKRYVIGIVLIARFLMLSVATHNIKTSFSSTLGMKKTNHLGYLVL